MSPWPSLPATPWPHCEVEDLRVLFFDVLRPALRSLRQRSTPYTLVADDKHVSEVGTEHGSTKFNRVQTEFDSWCTVVLFVLVSHYGSRVKATATIELATRPSMTGTQRQSMRA